MVKRPGGQSRSVARLRATCSMHTHAQRMHKACTGHVRGSRRLTPGRAASDAARARSCAAGRRWLGSVRHAPGTPMLYETPKDWLGAAPPAGGAVRHVGPRQDKGSGDAARGGRLVPLLGRFPHRHPLHGRAHRRQLQARGDAQPVPARAAALGLDLHRLEHHLPQPRAALDLPRQARRPGEGRHPVRRVPAPPAAAPRRRDRRHPRRRALHRQGRGHLRLRPLRRRHLGLALRGRRSLRSRRSGALRPRAARRCRSGSAAPRSTSTR